jgi:hypothetical protein
MHITVLVAALLTTLVTPALAQDDVAPTSCAALAEETGIIETTADTVIADTADGCRITDFLITPSAPSRFKVNELTLVAPGILDDYAAQRLPASLDLTLHGVLLSPETGSELTTYIIEMQAEPMDVHLSYRWDAAEGVLDLADLSVTAGELGGFRLTGRITDAQVTPDVVADPTRLRGALESLTLEMDNARFAAAYFAPPLVSMLPYDQDPRPLIASYIAAVNGFIASLPAANVSAESKDALTSFVSAFPRPRGDYTLEVTAEPPLALDEIALDTPIALAGILARLRIEATHTAP